MNLESTSPKKSAPVVSTTDDIDFDFKPITSGLGFHHNKTTEIKPAFHETPMPVQAVAPVTQTFRKEQAPVYQNDLSLFYNRETSAKPAPIEEVNAEKVYRKATKSQRTLAYVLDLLLVGSVLGLVLTTMARLIEMDLVEVWTSYPNEITPLVVVLFTGFYLMYFSIFEKTASSTLGKNMLSIRVVNHKQQSPSFSLLLLRSFISLTNFISLGLFSYFDLQNKICSTQVIKAE